MEEMGGEIGKEKRKAARTQSLTAAVAPKALLSEKILQSTKHSGPVSSFDCFDFVLCNIFSESPTGRRLLETTSRVFVDLLRAFAPLRLCVEILTLRATIKGWHCRSWP